MPAPSTDTSSSNCDISILEQRRSATPAWLTCAILAVWSTWICSTTRRSNAGLAHLVGLKKLNYLRISFAKVGDRGLVHLEKLSGLKNLVLGRTKVTENGIARLRSALPECNISLAEY
jgi:hypothetical protein